MKLIIMLIYAKLTIVNVCDWSAVCRLHDRKIFVLALCTLLSMSGGLQVLNDEAHHYANLCTAKHSERL